MLPKRGRPKGSRNRTKLDSIAEFSEPLKPLPKDPNSSELAIYKMLVQPLLSGTNIIFDMADVRELSKNEIDSGTFAFAAYMYQNWEDIDARHLIMLWLVGTVTPRLAEFEVKRRKEKAAQILADKTGIK